MDKRSVLVVSLLSLFLLFSFRGYAESVVLNNPLSNAVINRTIILNATTDYICDNATFYYSNNASNPWQSFIGSNITAGRNFTFSLDTNVITDGTYNFTVNVTNSTLVNFSTVTNITINNPPKWFNNTNSTPSGSQYLSGQLYQFNITWIDGNLSTILFEFNYTLNGSASGSPYNYSNASNSSGIFWINLIDLPAQTFVYRWIANDSSGNENSTNFLTYTINKNSSVPIVLTLNGTPENRNYAMYDTAGFMVSINLPSRTVYLNSTYPNWVTQNNTTSVLYNTSNLTVLGLYNLTAFWKGDENYTSNSTTYSFGVTPYCTNNIVSPFSDSTYSSGKKYNFSIECIGNISNVNFQWNSNLYPANNTSNIFYYNLTDLSAGNHNYRWHVTDNNSHTFNSSLYPYIINPIPVTLTLSCSDLDWSVSSGSSVTITCISNVSTNLRIMAGTINAGEGLSPFNVSLTNRLTSEYIDCSVINPNYTLVSTNRLLTVTGTSGNQGGGTGDNTGTSTGSFIIYGLTPTLSINPGESKQVSFTLKNTLGKGAIANVTISVTGISSNWYTPLSKINYSYNSVPQTLTLTFKIPSDAEANNYTIKIAATGKLIVNSSTINTPDATMKLTVASPQPIQPLPSETVQPPAQETAQQNETANITSNQTVSGATGLAATFEFFKNNLVIILAIAACLLIFIFRNNLTTALTGTLGKEEAETHKAKTASPLKGIKDKFNYKLIVNLKKESKAKSLKEPTEVQGAEKVPEMVPGKEPKRPAVLEKEIKRDIKELQSILDAENKVKKNKKKFNLGNN